MSVPVKEGMEMCGVDVDSGEQGPQARSRAPAASWTQAVG